MYEELKRNQAELNTTIVLATHDRTEADIFIFLAVLVRIPQTAIKSGRDVGTNKWQILRAIILPLTYKACLVNLVLLLI